MFNKKNAKSINALKKRVSLRSESREHFSETHDITEVSFSDRNIAYDIIGLISIITAGTLLLALISMDIGDTSLFGEITNSSINNMLGKTGALVSGYLMLLLGSTSFLIPIALLIIGVKLIIKNAESNISFIINTTSIAILILSIFFDTVLPAHFGDYKKGGIIGRNIRDTLNPILGDIGIILLLLITLAIVFMLYKKSSFKYILSKIDTYLSKMYKNRSLVLEKFTSGNKEMTNKQNKKNILDTIISYTPFVNKKNVSDLEYKVSPFIEILNIETDEESDEKIDINNYSKNKYEEESDEKYNYVEQKENVGLSNESLNKVGDIVSDIQNINNKDCKNLNDYYENENDLGLTLAKAIYGKDIKVPSEKTSILSDDFEVKLNKTNPSKTPEDFGINTAKKNATESKNFRESYKEYQNNINNIVDDKVEEIEEYDFLLTSNHTSYNDEITVPQEDAITENKPYEFEMGYSSFKKYDRENHIPSKTENKTEQEEDSIYYETVSNESKTNIDHNTSIETEYNSNNYNYSYEENNDYEENEPADYIYENTQIETEENNNYEHTENIDAVYEEPELKEIIFEKQEPTEPVQPQKKDLEYNRNVYVQKNRKMANISDEFIQSNYDSKFVDKNYKVPNINLLNRSIPINDHEATNAIRHTALQLENTLLDFNVEAKVTGVSRGPVVTRYELDLASGTRVSKIVSLTDNIALGLASESVRIIAPIPGRSVIGIEIPNKIRSAVYLRDVLESADFKSTKSEIPFVLGKGIYGNNVVADMADAPHLLVAGTTGSGKSVCLSTIILSLLFKFRPDELKFLFIDKKRVELSIYNGIPHLMSPVVSDDKKATVVLRHIVEIMERRYERMEKFFVRNVKAYNEKVRQLLKNGEHDFEGEPLELFPYIVLVIDELHNLMVVASKEVEDLISRLAGMSRAVGIHIIIATQRPSADVVTGVIKANLPTRIAFQVPNKTNSRIIIDMAGAEQLLGKGDALFCSSGTQMPDRVQAAFVSDDEVKKVVDFLAGQMPSLFDESLIHALEKNDNDDKNNSEEDILDEELWDDAINVISRTGKASASFLQRKLKIGYNRAARIIDLMEQQGLVGPENGSKPREVFINTYE